MCGSVIGGVSANRPERLQTTARVGVVSPYAVDSAAGPSEPVDVACAEPARAAAAPPPTAPSLAQRVFCGLSLAVSLVGVGQPAMAQAVQQVPLSLTVSPQTSRPLTVTSAHADTTSLGRADTTSHGRADTTSVLHAASGADTSQARGAAPADTIVTHRALVPPAVPSVAPADATATRAPVIAVIGDSISAGTEDAVTDEVRQQHDFGQQLADDLHIPFSNPNIGANGIPPALFVQGRFDVANYLQEISALTKAATPVAIKMTLLGGVTQKDLYPIWTVPGMGKRTPQSLDTPQHPQSNFAVSGFELRHMTDVRGVDDYVREVQSGAEAPSGLASETPLIHEQLQNGTDQPRGSAVEQAIAHHPDLTIAWGGNNDALGAIFGGVVDDRSVTPILDQQWNFWTTNPLNQHWFMTHTDGEVKGYLHAMSASDGMIDQLLRGTSGPIVTMTVPNVTSIPYLRTIGQPVGPMPFHVVLHDGTDVTSRMSAIIVPDRIVGRGNGGRTSFPPGSRVGLIKLLQMVTTDAKGQPITTSAQFDARVQQIQKDGAFSEFDVLDPDEVARIQSRVTQFNEILRKKAAENPRVHIIDMNAVFDRALKDGIALRGEGPDVHVTATFTGVHDARGYEGIFGFDGVHPSYVGHAIVANLILDVIKTDLAGDPIFAQYHNAPYIDEKAALRNDPHFNGQWSVVLDTDVLNHLAAQHGTSLSPVGQPGVSDRSTFPLGPLPSLPSFGSSSSTSAPQPAVASSNLFDLPDGAPAPPISRTPHENWNLRIAPKVTAGTEFQAGPHHGFGVAEAAVTQQFGFDYKAGDWEDHAHLTASVGSQVGLHYDPSLGPGGNLSGRIGVDNTLRRDLGNGFGLRFDADAGVQGGFGRTFDHENPLTRFDASGSLLLDKKLGAANVYAGPFISYVGDFHGVDTHENLGLRAGAGVQLSNQDRLQIEGRTWHESRRDGDTKNFGGWLQLDHQVGDSRVVVSPFVGYQTVPLRDHVDGAVVGGIKVSF